MTIRRLSNRPSAICYSLSLMHELSYFREHLDLFAEMARNRQISLDLDAPKAILRSMLWTVFFILTMIAGVTFWFGMAFVLGAGLAFHASAISAINHLYPLINALIGVGPAMALGSQKYSGPWADLAAAAISRWRRSISSSGPIQTARRWVCGPTICSIAEMNS